MVVIVVLIVFLIADVVNVYCLACVLFNVFLRNVFNRVVPIATKLLLRCLLRGDTCSPPSFVSSNQVF